jgi:hypothetical protein
MEPFMKNKLLSKENASSAALAFFALAAGVFLFRDELFPPMGIYLRYIGAQDFPVAPVVITSRRLPLEKVKSEFNSEIPQAVPQFTPDKRDLKAMIQEVLRRLPPGDCDPSEAQFVITVTGVRGARTVETDSFHSMAVVNTLLQSARPRYLQLSIELLNLEDYSRLDKRHLPVLPGIPPKPGPGGKTGPKSRK